MKKIFVSLWLAATVVVIATLFWYNDFVYSLPTPVPTGYKPVTIGSKMTLHQLPFGNDYRGNYNSNRYRTGYKTNFAKMAIEDVLKRTTHPAFNLLAIKTYGCSLPGCGNKKD
jgi:hypothetical protein